VATSPRTSRAARSMAPKLIDEDRRLATSAGRWWWTAPFVVGPAYWSPVDEIWYSSRSTGPHHPRAADSGGISEYISPVSLSRYQCSTCDTSLFRVTGTSSTNPLSMACLSIRCNSVNSRSDSNLSLSNISRNPFICHFLSAETIGSEAHKLGSLGLSGTSRSWTCWVQNFSLMPEPYLPTSTP
jgi:hypothetical protein